MQPFCQNPQLSRSLENELEQAVKSGELKLQGKNLKDFPKSGGRYKLEDTTLAGRILSRPTPDLDLAPGFSGLSAVNGLRPAGRPGPQLGGRPCRRKGWGVSTLDIWDHSDTRRPDPFLIHLLPLSCLLSVWDQYRLAFPPFRGS